MNLLRLVHPDGKKQKESETFKKLREECKEQTGKCEVKFSKEELKERLTPLQYRVTQEKGTERPWSGKYVRMTDYGVFQCIVCSEHLFHSDEKFTCSSGWPSFSDVIERGKVSLSDDTTNGMVRIEAKCAKCGAHLGHVFDDGKKGGNILIFIKVGIFFMIRAGIIKEDIVCTLFRLAYCAYIISWILNFTMSTANTTLSSLWIEDGQTSPMKKFAVGASGKPSEVKQDLLKFYHESHTQNQQAGILDSGGQLTENQQPRQGQGVMIPVQIASPVKSSPFKEQAQILPKYDGSPMILGTPQRAGGGLNQHVVSSPRTPQYIQVESPGGWPGQRKRTSEFLDADFFAELKKGKKGEKGGKGLRHFSMKVCEKVQKKGVTSYNEVADELVHEFSDPRNISPTDQAYDQKNIRRRVYDALNVLMAMNIISKEKKEIRWIGLPTNSAQECQNLELEKQRRIDRINHKTQQLQELILQQIAFKNLVERNKALERTQGPPTPNSAIQLPFIIVNTSKKTVIDCSISNDKYEYLFNFDNTFEIHDDIEVLKRMGMAFQLEKGQSTDHDLKKAIKMVPKSLEPYVYAMANVAPGSSSSSSVAGPSGIHTLNPTISIGQTQSLTSMGGSLSSTQDSTDAEVALTVAGSHDMSHDLTMADMMSVSRQSSVGSFSRSETPLDNYSDDDSERSSPVEIN
ncbi:unnamed protein product [Owenia fusiformis]|uniref:MsrB domain-containing protein n=1 Tax=Owenia fusiformis TaxID=6347 RepID=A0A8S4NMG5_OWEFU|nr:unnamed protein product [Owenia fusiformis]